MLVVNPLARRPARNLPARQRNTHDGTEGNPTATTWTLIGVGGAALLGVVIGGVTWARRRKKQLPPVVTPPGGGGGSNTGGGGGTTKNYVGSGWNWPKRYFFPEEASFGDALQNLGYGNFDPNSPNFTVLSSGVMQSVKEFQRDWNIVRSQLSQGPASLGVDGLIGTNTLNALEIAVGFQNAPISDGWLTLVENTKNAVT
jgi:hypothetical protein